MINTCSGVIGGTLTGPLIFILPPLFYTRMRQLERKSKIKLIEENEEMIMNDTDLLLRNMSNYGSIDIPDSEDHRKQLQLSLSKNTLERLIALFVIVFGITATFTSTYYNIIDIKGLKEFWSPCIQNITLSKFLLPK